MAMSVIFGNNDFLRHRAVEQTIAKQRKNGWDIDIVEGTDTTALMAALTQSFGMFDESLPVLVVVKNPEKAPLDALQGFVKKPTPNVMVLLSIEGEPKGNTKFGKFVDGLDKKFVQKYSFAEKKWEIPKEAAAFCVAEAKRLGKPMGEELAAALVKTSGTDYGYLAFEIQKAVLYAEARKSDKLTLEDVKAALAPIGEVSFDGVREALVSRNPKAVASALNRVYKLSKDPTMGMAGYLEAIAIGSKTEREGKVSFGWLHLTTLRQQGLSGDQIAERLGTHPWRTNNILLPEVRAWTPEAVLQLLRIAATTRRAVVSGQQDPWVVLTSGIIALCVSR